MRLRFILFLLVIAASAVSAWLMQKDPGYVLIAYNGNSIEMTLWLAAVSLITAILVLYLLLKLPRWILSPLHLAGRFIGGQRDKDTRDGMVAFLEGDYHRAKRLLENSAKYSVEPVVPYVMAAISSEKLGQPEKADMFLRLANHTESQDFLVGLSRADIFCQRGEFAQAKEILDALSEKQLNHPRLTSMLIDVNKQLGEQGDLFPKLKQLKKRLPSAEYSILEVAAIKGRLEEVAQQGEAEVEVCWNALDKRQKHIPELVLIYAGLMAKGSESQQTHAAKTIKALLKKQWSDECALVFASLKTSMPEKNLKLAEQWLESQPDNPNLMIAVARLSLQNKLWGQAKNYFESAIRLRPSAEIYAELARLCDRLGESTKRDHYRQLAITSSVPHLPDLPLPD